MLHKPNCYDSNPSPDEQAENDCIDCAFKRDCLAEIPTLNRLRKTNRPTVPWLSVVEPPPRDEKVLLYASSGVCLIGHYTPDQAGFITHWCRLPRKPRTI